MGRPAVRGRSARRPRPVGYDGLEIACWGDHMDVRRRRRRPRLRRASRKAHPRASTASGAGRSAPTSPASASATACDPRLDGFAPRRPSRASPRPSAHWAAEEMKAAARAAAAMGCHVVTGFMGSPDLAGYWYSFPPTTEEMVEAAFAGDRASSGRPSSTSSTRAGVSFALEVHPTEIAFDSTRPERLLDAFDGRPDPRLQLRPEPPRLAGRRAAPLHPRLRRPRSTTCT
ncbi:MAG: hypothetical protein MZV64_68075 [Ignavibacteriales bacterium]|nr:hypothetical protein [Ignavibacteriales bacterium]